MTSKYRPTSNVGKKMSSDPYTILAKGSTTGLPPGREINNRLTAPQTNNYSILSKKGESSVKKSKILLEME